MNNSHETICSQVHNAIITMPDPGISVFDEYQEIRQHLRLALHHLFAAEGLLMLKTRKTHSTEDNQWT